MADITYCTNTSCPFASCARHHTHMAELAKTGQRYVSVADFGGTCRDYLHYLLEEVRLDT